MKKPSASREASPYKSVAEELERLRKGFRSLSQRYSARIETEITGLRDKVLSAGEASLDAEMTVQSLETVEGTETATAKPKAKAGAATGGTKAEEAHAKQTSQFHDLRDMLALLRTFEINPEVAARRDFKRLENMLEELRLLARHWA